MCSHILILSGSWKPDLAVLSTWCWLQRLKDETEKEDGLVLHSFRKPPKHRQSEAKQSLHEGP